MYDMSIAYIWHLSTLLGHRLSFRPGLWVVSGAALPLRGGLWQFGAPNAAIFPRTMPGILLWSSPLPVKEMCFLETFLGVSVG